MPTQLHTLTAELAVESAFSLVTPRRAAAAIRPGSLRSEWLKLCDSLPPPEAEQERARLVAIFQDERVKLHV